MQHWGLVLCAGFVSAAEKPDAAKLPVKVFLLAGQSNMDGILFLSFYAVPPEDVGAKLELRFNGEVLPFTITKGHNAKVLGEGTYRSKRGEGQEKDFMRVTMGKITVAKGQGALELVAVEKPGAIVAEVRLLLLSKVQ